jgi:serine/threonine protein phosphatase PrpC
LVEGLYDHHLVDILHESKSQQSCADRSQRLVKEAVQNSGRDNTTALVIEIV